MSDRYWRGGTGTWNNTVANWSTTSGGSGGASVPTSSDNVFIDGNSGGGVITATGPNLSTFSATLVAASSQYLTAANSATLAITGNITAEFWVKLTSAPSASVMKFINKLESQYAYSFEYAESSGLKLRMRVSSDGSTIESLEKVVDLGTGTWKHVAFSWTAATATCEYFVNGVSLGTTVGTKTSIFNGTDVLYIGQDGGGGSFLNGQIDEIRIWSSARTAAQILANYQIEIDATSGLNASWHLDNALTDASGNTNTLTNHSATFTSDVPTLLTGFLTFGDITYTGFAGTITGTPTVTCAGSMTLASGMTYSITGAHTFSATATGKTITSSGKTINADITFNGSGGGWTFQDAMTTKSIALTLGALSLGSNTVTLTSTGSVWNATSGTLIAGTSTIKLTDASSSSKTFVGASLTYNNLWITGAGSGTYTITGSNTFADFKVDTPPHTVNFTAGTLQTLQTFTVNGTAGNLMTLQSTSAGSSWFLKRLGTATISCDYLSLKDSHAS